MRTGRSGEAASRELASDIRLPDISRSNASTRARHRSLGGHLTLRTAWHPGARQVNGSAIAQLTHLMNI